MSNPRILCFAGSTSSRSINHSLVEFIAGITPHIEPTIIHLQEYVAPIFSVDLEKQGYPEVIQQLVQLIKSHDGFIIGTPEHNSLMTAHMKNTLDWLSRVEKGLFGYKPVFLCATSPGKRGAKGSLEHTERLLGYLGAKVNATYSLGSFNEMVDRSVGFRLTEVCEEKKLQELVHQWRKESFNG